MADRTGSADRGREPAFARWINALAELAGYTSAVLILVATLVICYGVALRYLFGASTIWQTELSIYLLMYASFVGAAYGLRHGDHVKITLVVDRMPVRFRQLCKALAAFLGFALVVVISIQGVELWWDAFDNGRRSGTAWNPPLSYPFAILPIGMVVLALQFVLITLESVAKFRFGTADEPEPTTPNGQPT